MKMGNSFMKITKYSVELTDALHPSLVKEKSYLLSRNNISSSTDLMELLSDDMHLDLKAEEYVYMIALNTKLKPLGIFEISHGTLDKALISPREIFMRALLIGAKYIIIAHNHPSGDLKPSDHDNKAFIMLETAGELLNIRLVDFVIVSRAGFYSYANNRVI